MASLSKPSAVVGLLIVLFAFSAAGQITNPITFETTFPFYAGNAKMPAGSYRVSPTDISGSLLLIEDSDGSHSAFVEFTPTQSDNPHQQSDVTFKKYGKVDFLDRLWIQGQTTGAEIIPEKAEQVAAKSTAPSQHSVPLKSTQ